MASRWTGANDGGGSRKEQRETLSRKEYDNHLAALHVERVKLQEWGKHKGLMLCIVFEGRDGAGKGGTIKAMDVIMHILSRIPYKDLPHDKIQLPKRQKPHGYREPDYPYKFVPENF